MHKLIVISILIAALIAVYVMMVRPFLRARPELKEVFDTLDKQEAGIFQLAWAYFEGFRTILFARVLVIAPALAAGLEVFGALPFADLLPPKFALFAAPLVMLIGMAVEGLRRITTTPVPSVPPEPVKVDPVLDGSSPKPSV